MENRKNMRKILSAAVILASLLAVFLIVYHLPGKIDVTVHAAPYSVGSAFVENEGGEAEFTLRLTRWKRLFGDDLLSGSIVYNGVEYVKTDGWRTPNEFHTPRTPGEKFSSTSEQLNWMQNKIIARINGKTAELDCLNPSGGEIALYAFKIGD